MQLHADTHTHTKDSKTFLFPTVELFQLARNTDITKKKLRFQDIGQMCPITDIQGVTGGKGQTSGGCSLC